MTHARVLIVEDNPIVALAMSEAVLSLGYDVVGPEISLRTGMMQAFEGDFDYALLDFDLGAGETSALIAKSLRAKGIGFAFVSEVEPALIREEFSGAPFLAKPVGSRDLEKLLAH